MQKEFFSSRFTLILSTLGIAVGTGNIWRFPRIVAQNGGGTFLIPWLVFLFLWSLPLIIAEFAIGKHTRLSPVLALAKLSGRNFMWMGAFVAFVSTAIMFYYSVVTGWCLNYFFSAVSGNLLSLKNHFGYWNNFNNSFLPLVFQIIVMILGAGIIYRGVTKGIEYISKILVSSLIVIIIILAIRAVTLPNAISGIEYFFTPDLNKIFDFKIWLAALTQNAWDTGAGWGLILTYAIYLRKRDDIALNASLIGFGNNSVSLIAGIIIFSTTFALSEGNPLEKISVSGPANTGMTFIMLPQLFSRLSDSFLINSIFASLFFIALSMAAFTSLVSMIELASKSLTDFGIHRTKAIIYTTLIGIVFGIPSAINTDFLINQDWVWGIGLILSGAFISFSVIKFGVEKFRIELIIPDSDFYVGKFYNFIIKYLIPLQAAVLLFWWLYSSVSWDSEWLNPFHAENVGTCLFQWGIVLSILFILNRELIKRKFL
jgi:NSS family neurotransmitter:Na+ symporter